MKNIDKLKSMTIDELAEYIAENWIHDNDPVITWFDENHCKKCDSVIIDSSEYAWCEVHKKCPFFLQLNGMPENKDMIKLWLESKEV